MIFMNESKNKRKALKYLLIVVIFLFLLVIGATYAYFTVSGGNSFGTKTIGASAESAGTVILNGSQANLILHVTAPDMMNKGSDVTYWGTSDGTPSTTQNIVTLGSTQVTGTKTYNCSYTLNATASGTNNMYTAFQGMTGKSANQLVLKIGDNTYDFNTANLFPITVNGTLEGVTASESQSITAEFYLVNKTSLNQNALASTDININISATNFSCTAIIPPVSASDYLVDLCSSDNTIVAYSGKVTDDVSQIGTGVDATKVCAFTSNTNNNVVFANHCWQIRRTTETGGVKIQYNGEPTLGTDGSGNTTYDCGTSRPYHMGDAKIVISLNGTKLYGDGYTKSISGSTTTFTLTNTESVKVTSSNGSSVISGLVGKYVCSNGTASCTNTGLYKIDSWSDSYNANVYASTYNDSIGRSQFNTNGISIGHVGYMYNIIYPSVEGAFVKSQKIVSSSTYVKSTGIIDNGDGTFTMSGTVNEIAGSSWSSNYANYSSKYICMPGYWTNNNGTYICDDNGEQNVAALRRTTVTTSTSFTYYPVYKYGYGIEQSGNSYQLTAKDGEDQTLQYVFYYESSSTSNCFANETTKISTCGYKTLSKSHYTCLNLTGTCSNYYYINETGPQKFYAVEISEGKYVSTDLADTNNVLYEMLAKNDINTTNSTVKGVVDFWYQKNILNTIYEPLIEQNAIFCNDRRITNFGGWNPDGGTPHANFYMYFSEQTTSSNLNCVRSLDSFSTSNNNAKLSYPVGLMSNPEMNVLGNNNVRSSRNDYWILSSFNYMGYVGSATFVLADGSLSSFAITNSLGFVRPALVLNSSATFSSGTGSTSDPYIVAGSEMTP